MNDRIVVATVALASAAMLPTGALAQTALNVHVSSGAATDQRGVRSAAVTVAPVLTLRESARTALTLFASGTQFAQSAHSLSGGTAFSVRSAPALPVGVSLTADAAYTGTSFSARFVNAQAAAMLEWRPGPVTLAGGLRTAYGNTSYRTTTANGPQGGGNGGLGGLLGQPLPESPAGSRVVDARSLRGPQAQAAAHFRTPNGRTATRIALGYGGWRGAALRNVIGSDALHDVTVSTAVATGPLTLQGMIGRRIQSGDSRSADFGSAQMEVSLSRVFAVTAGGGSYLADPVSGALGGRFLTAGLSMKFGGARRGMNGGSARTKAPAVRGADALPRSHSRLVIRAAHATTVHVAGDWNAWQRQPARKARDGVWYVDVALEPGEYRYAFLIDGSEWRVPEHAVTGDDGLGGKVAWLSVRTSAR